MLKLSQTFKAKKKKSLYFDCIIIIIVLVKFIAEKAALQLCFLTNFRVGYIYYAGVSCWFVS